MTIRRGEQPKIRIFLILNVSIKTYRLKSLKIK